MHQTTKGKQWYFGMKAHIGVDSEQADPHRAGLGRQRGRLDALPYLLHGEETRVWGDQGYQGQAR